MESALKNTWGQKSFYIHFMLHFSFWLRAISIFLAVDAAVSQKPGGQSNGIPSSSRSTIFAFALPSSESSKKMMLINSFNLLSSMIFNRKLSINSGLCVSTIICRSCLTKSKNTSASFPLHSGCRCISGCSKMAIPEGFVNKPLRMTGSTWLTPNLHQKWGQIECYHL